MSPSVKHENTHHAHDSREFTGFQKIGASAGTNKLSGPSIYTNADHDFDVPVVTSNDCQCIQLENQKYILIS